MSMEVKVLTNLEVGVLTSVEVGYSRIWRWEYS